MKAHEIPKLQHHYYGLHDPVMMCNLLEQMGAVIKPGLHSIQGHPEVQLTQLSGEHLGVSTSLFCLLHSKETN